MDLNETYAQLTVVLQDFFDTDDIVARPDLTADQVDGWDSLADGRLMLTIERKFGISLSAQEISSLENVGDLAKLVSSKTGS